MPRITADGNKMPAKLAMAQRTRVTFGKAYLRDLAAGVQHDIEKQIVHGVALGLGTRSQLKKLTPQHLRERLLEALSTSDSPPTSAHISH